MFFDNLKNRFALPIVGSPDMTDAEFILKEINDFKASPVRKMRVNGKRYFIGQHDILRKKRTAIGVGGNLVEVTNLPNNKIVDNQYRKAVKKKVNYLVGKPFTMKSDNDEYLKALNYVFDKNFRRLLKLTVEDSLNCGVAFLHPTYNEAGEFIFKRLRPENLIVEWADEEHTKIDCAIRFYTVASYTKKERKEIMKVEVFTQNGIDYYEQVNERLIPVEPFHMDYFTMSNEQSYNWSKIPIIPVRYNAEELPLISMVKSLQDGVNTILSNFQNNMEEDARNTIMVLVNYAGQNLAEFRQNLSMYGAVSVSTVDGVGGDVKTLQVEVNAENYKAILQIFKDAIIENAMSFDSKDDRLNGTPNQMNIQSMYSDIDLDANDMETELQASLEQILWFVDAHLANSGKGDFASDEVEIVFNRDMLMNEGEKIQNLRNSVGMISNETIVSEHPYVDDPQAELDRMKQEEATANGDEYGGAFATE